MKCRCSHPKVNHVPHGCEICSCYEYEPSWLYVARQIAYCGFVALVWMLKVALVVIAVALILSVVNPKLLPVWP